MAYKMKRIDPIYRRSTTKCARYVHACMCCLVLYLYLYLYRTVSTTYLFYNISIAGDVA
jgi:hypothetical protein